MASGRRSGLSCTWRCVSGWVASPARQRWSSTASRSNRRKGGGKDDKVGYDAGKKVKGRKIHALVDSEGLPMRVVVHSAAIQDRDGAGLVLDKIRRRFPWLELIWADGGYNAWQVDAAVAKVPRLRLAIVKRSDDVKGFVVLPRRWGGRAHLFLVRAQPAACRGFQEPHGNPGHLRHPRFDPARPQAACPGVGPGLNTVAGGERLLSDRSADLAVRTGVTQLRRKRLLADPRPTRSTLLRPIYVLDREAEMVIVEPESSTRERGKTSEPSAALPAMASL